MTATFRQAEEHELRGLVGRCWEAVHTVRPISDDNRAEVRATVTAIVRFHESRWIRWLDVLEQHRAERRLRLLAEADELERAIQRRLDELRKDAAA